MDDDTAGKLQIYSVEYRGAEAAVCIVRCVGGVVQTGRQFTIDQEARAAGGMPPVALDWINRYEQLTDFIDPPHSAKVHFSGEGVRALERGVILVSIQLGDPR